MKAKHKTIDPTGRDQVLAGDPIAKLGLTWVHLRCMACAKPTARTCGRKRKRWSPPPPAPAVPERSRTVSGNCR